VLLELIKMQLSTNLSERRILFSFYDIQYGYLAKKSAVWTKICPLKRKNIKND